MIYVLFSGGLDSWFCLNWSIEQFGVERIRAIYFDVGQQYSSKEWFAAEKLCYARGVALDYVDLERLVEDRATGRIPLRNMVFLTTVAAFADADGVVFGMLRGECPEDKNPAFVRQMQGLFTVLLPERRFTIYTPMAKLTKRRAVEVGLSRFGAVFDKHLPDTIGCFSADVRPCGSCMSCFNRWVALYLVGVRCAEQNWVEHPAIWMLQRLARRKGRGERRPSFIRLGEGYKALNRFCHERYDTSALRKIWGW